jgi:signal transduction histidine kinase
VVIYLIIRNSKKKQVIALQKEKIKTQLFEQELKTQELNGIDAIISAQEEERSKMAADLHDNLGSKVATLKLYIEGFEEQDGFDQFHEKVKNLTADTYDEIRKVAKNKNFGAQISKGLIPSTEAIAAQIEDVSDIDIKVLNVDVERRIENRIEIQLFRIIQELLTNIIKHANAKEVVIQFSEHTNMLNIIVEDDGRGFNPNNPSNGIGLYTVESRVEKIDGNLVIDSSEGNGTTIIINIPI